jgi:RNA polymerase sigma factor (sigma-70 family)
MPPAQAGDAPPGANGDADGFEAFYLAAAERTFRAACRMTAGDQEVAWDVTQDAYIAMMACWPSRRGLPVEDNLRYVIGIASHKVVDWYRAPDNKCAELDGVDGLADEPTPADTLSEQAVLNAVRDLLDGQPAHRRAVGVLYFLEGWKQLEIAATLDLDPSTVRTQVQRLRVRLRPLIHRINNLDQGGDQR